MKPSIPALRVPGTGLVVATAEKASLLGSQFDSTQLGVVRSLSLFCLVSLSIGAILLSFELLSSCVYFSILIRMGVLILWTCVFSISNEGCGY